MVYQTKTEQLESERIECRKGIDRFYEKLDRALRLDYEWAEEYLSHAQYINSQRLKNG